MFVHQDLTGPGDGHLAPQSSHIPLLWHGSHFSEQIRNQALALLLPSNPPNGHLHSTNRWTREPRLYRNASRWVSRVGADSPKQLQAILLTKQFLEKRDARRQGGDKAGVTGDGSVGRVSVRVPVCKGVRTERAVFSQRPSWMRSHTGSQDQSLKRNLKEGKNGKHSDATEKPGYPAGRDIGGQGRRDSARKLQLRHLSLSAGSAVARNSGSGDDHLAPSEYLMRSGGANNCSNDFCIFPWYHFSFPSNLNFQISSSSKSICT